MPKVVDVTLKLIDSFTKPLKNAMSEVENSQRQLKNVAKSFQTVGGAISSAGSTMTAAFTVPIVSGFTAATKTYMDYEQAVTSTAAVSGIQKGTDAWDKLNAKITELNNNTAASNTEIAELYGYMALAGWDLSNKDVLDRAEAMIKLSEATGMEFATTSDLVTDSMSAMQIATKDYQSYMSLVADANMKSNQTAQQFLETVIGGGSTAKMMGVLNTEFASMASILADNGTKGAEAGTALNSMLARLAKSNIQDKLTDYLGISLQSYYDAFGNFNAQGLFTDIYNQTAGMIETEREAILGEIFGTNYLSQSVQLMNAAVDAGSKGWAAYSAEYQRSYNEANSLNELWANSTDTLAYKLELLKSKIAGFATVLGERLSPYLEPLITFVSNLTDKLNSLSAEELDQVIKIAAIVATVGPVLMLIGKFITGIGNLIFAIQNISKAFTTLKSGIGLAGKFFGVLSVKMIAIIAIIAAVAAAVYLIITNWDKIKPFLLNLWDGIKSFFIKLKDGFLDVVNFVKDVFVARFNIYLSALKGYVSAWIDGIKGVIEGIKTVFQGIINFVTGVFTGNWKKAWEGVKQIFGGIFSSLVSLVKTPFNAIIGLINGAISGINAINITVPSWVPGVGGRSIGFSIPKIPMLYKGTDNWKGGTAIINEKAYGGEIVDLPSGSRVYPHDESIERAYKDGASSTNSSITIPKLADTIIVREDADIDRIVNQLVVKLTKATANLGGAMA